ncbi:MliC family protein [Leptotrichia sp. oral taxon 847]|uniref:MliC family protein n=1 Tax=Leptotrichia sp. oral taxon 847 TaxID=1785996 RepID=UPI0007680369|nr:MliC family protein [Leptotrichia sp. oral taxon 847]AMD95274.1 hypothetical protein AXF11_06625 [Leptotrichia sp. oral taxon 847]
MKTKRMITMAIAAIVLGSFSVSYAASRNARRTRQNTTKTTKVSKNSPKLVESKDYTCGSSNLKADFFDNDIAKVKVGKKVYNLKRAVSASGEYFEDGKGVSLHVKGDEGVFTVGGVDKSCEVAGKKSTSEKQAVTYRLNDETLKNRNIKVEYGNDTAKVTDFNGDVHNLKRAKSASGMYFEDTDGVSLHVKGKEGIFTISGVDYSFEQK